MSTSNKIRRSILDYHYVASLFLCYKKSQSIFKNRNWIVMVEIDEDQECSSIKLLIFLHQAQDMKEELFPLFYKNQDSKSRQIEPEPFIQHLSALRDPHALIANLKPIEENIRILSKQHNNLEPVIKVISLLCNMFKSAPTPEMLTLVRAALSADVKFEAKGQPVDDVLHREQNVRMAVSDQPIALPCGPEEQMAYGPHLPGSNYSGPVIALHNQDAMSDVGDQKKQGESKSYFILDNENIGTYLQKPFKVVKRQGISELFTLSTEIISSELMQHYLQSKLSTLPLNVIVQLLKLLDYISPAIYSFHLLNIAKAVTEQLHKLLQIKQIDKTMTKDHFQSISSTFNSIAERWSDYAGFSIEQWNWQTDHRMISLFIKSQVSQKKLFAVKSLGEICRKSTHYTFTITPEKIKEFISSKGILEEIFRPDNHPEVIAKGEEVFLYMTKDGYLNKHLIDLVFNLLEKCHQNLSKSLLATLQRVEQKNIQNNREYLLQKIEELPRPNCFNQETFALIKRIILVTPPGEVQASLLKIYKVIEKNYDKLRENLKKELITLYYEVYVMGIQMNIFNQTNALSPLKLLLDKPQSSLYLRMIEAFIRRLKDKTYHQSYGLKCRKTLHEGIKQLIRQQKIHELRYEDGTHHLCILMLLLENYEEMDNQLLAHEELWNLIKIDSKFTKFIRYYPETIQIDMISSLIKIQNKSSHDLECIIDLYHLMTAKVRENLAPLIISQFYQSNNLIEKYTLAPEVLEIEPFTFQEAIDKTQKSSEDPLKMISWLILGRQILKKQDEKGFGEYPPFELLANSYEVEIKVTRYTWDYKSSQFELKCKSYDTLYEITSKLLAIYSQPFDKSKIKLGQKYLQFNDLKKRVSSMTGFKKVQMEIYEIQQSEWIDKSQLLDKDNMLRLEVSDSLTEIFKKYASEGKLTTENIAQIFKVATKNDYISKYDSRVTQIITLHSNNGQSLTLEEWLNFYHQSTQKNAPLVVSNLTNLGYGSIFSKATSFQQNFKSDHSLRKSIIEDSRPYKTLFCIYSETVSKCLDEPLKMKLTDQIIKTFNLLPVCKGLLQSFLEHRQAIFEEGSDNIILHWYISKILKGIYFEDFKVEDYQKWGTLFVQSNNFNTAKLIYIKYLEIILLKGSEEFIVNNSIVIAILENIGRIIRESLKKIPNLTNIDFDELPPLSSKDIDSFLEISIIDFSEAIGKLASLCLSISKVKGNISIVENSLAVVSHFILKTSVEHSVGHLPVLQSMIFNEKEPIRSIFNSFYYLLSEVAPSIKEGYYSIHINNKSKSSKHCKQYFKVLSKILSFQDNQDRYNQISTIFQKDISQYSPSQSFENFSVTDEILLGELKVLNYIKLYNPKITIQQSTVDSIKNLLQTNSSEEIREILYSISSSICSFETNMQVISKIMANLKLSRNSLLRGKTKMGMQNLGCICYINSVIQQLEMIEPFRAGIINTEASDSPNDFFKEFQQMFYQLTFGQRIYLVPENFCLNYLDSSGNPVNIKEQHDADEFLNQLFDRLENRLRDTTESGLISNNFKGEVVNVISCDKCFHKKERVETFYILSVQIKNLKTLEECINKYAETQIICDYFCQTCDTKVETIQKYHRFHSLPPFLFIHLQRLVFDLESMYKIKLDHPIEFPHQLDLSSFFNVQCPEPAIYTLKGFVVHVGSSQGGHYYSLIKCDGQWIKFDDTRIDVWKWQQGSNDKSNAYMLIYQKKIQKDMIKQDTKIGNQAMVEEIKRDNFYLLKEKIFLQPSFTKYVLQTLSQISKSEEFCIETSELMNPYHQRFSELPAHIASQLDSAFDSVLQYFKLESQSRQLNLQGSWNQMQDGNENSNKDNSELQKIAIYLMYILHFRPQSALILQKQYSSSTDGNMFTLIYNHRDQQVRQISKTILFKVLSIIKSQIFTSFLVPVPQNELLQKLLQKIIVSLCEVGKNPNKMLSFFQLINMLVKSDKRFGEWFQCNKLGPRLIHFLMGSESPLGDAFPNYPFYLTMARKQTSISVIIEILIELIVFQKNLQLQSEDTKIQRKAYLNFQFYRRIFQDRYDNERLPTIINFCSRNNPEFTNKIVVFIIESLNRFNHTDKYVYTFLNILYNLLTLNDGLQRERVERLLGIPLPWKKYDKEGEEYMIAKETDRFCRYENSSQKKGDQIILAFLELLYVNRKEQDYFVYIGIAALLKLMTTYPSIAAYVQNLPGPCPKYPSYTEWIVEYVYESERTKNQSHRDITPEQKNSALKEIASLINKYENVQSDSGQNFESRTLHHSSSNKPYDIGKINNYSEWCRIDLSFGKNLMVKDLFPEGIKELSQSEFLIVDYRMLFGSKQQEDDSIQLLEFKMTFNCKVKIWFSSGYPYTLHFEKGFFEFALPYFEDQTAYMICETAEGQLGRILNNRKEKEMKKMQIEQKPDHKATIEQEFPTVAEAYPCHDAQMAANDTKMKEQLPSDIRIECPFCGCISHQFTSRCKNCNEEWGYMA